MAGSSNFSAIGAGYVTRYKNKPLISVIWSMMTNIFQVLERKSGSNWREIIADFKYRDHAETFAKQLKKYRHRK